MPAIRVMSREVREAAARALARKEGHTGGLVMFVVGSKSASESTSYPRDAIRWPPRDAKEATDDVVHRLLLRASLLRLRPTIGLETRPRSGGFGCVKPFQRS